MNTMSKGWKKYWKQVLFDWENFPDFGMLYAVVTVLATPIFVMITGKNPTLLFGGITFFITTLLFLCLTVLDAKEMQRNEEEKELEAIQQKEIKETENFYDILNDIEVLIEEHTYDITEDDAPFLDEVEKLLQDIEYIEKKCDLMVSEREEILLQIPKQVRLIVESYFEVFPSKRKELTLELLPTIQEQREVLRKTYIQPYQDKVIHICKTNTENLRKEKREYLYIQD